MTPAIPRYVNNIRIEELRQKVDHELLIAVQGRRVSVGEFIAHAARLSSLDAIGKTMTQLLGCDFFALVKDARDPWERRELGDDASPVLESPEDVFADVRGAFKFRNVVCHEAHPRESIGPAEVKRFSHSCYDFARAAYYGVAYHRNPAPPLTLEESLAKIRDTINNLETEIVAIEGRIISALPSQFRDSFSAMQEAWRRFVDREALFSSWQEANLGRGELNGKRLVEAQYRKRLNVLKEYSDKLG